MSETLGHYRIVRKIGEGGMGEVYEARDERLARPVAIKIIRRACESVEARKRLWREARSLARVSHPHICQIFDVDEDGETLFLVLELLEGESLAQRLARGPLSPAETVRIGGEVLAALDALHGPGIVHRDLKPSNVFLTRHGVKLLDFGLARAYHATCAAGAEAARTATDITRPGSLSGTPHYMSPEQVTGMAAGPEADLFAAGAILYEMLAGRRAFEGDSCVDVLYNVAHRHPPSLGGSPEIEALDPVIRRSLAKRPQDRYASAAEMSAALDSALRAAAAPPHAGPRAAMRLIALPFRVLRRDEDTDFLAYSLPDAISTSLSGIDSLIVRSSLAAARFEGQAPDPRRIAAEAGVDAILTGALLRVGAQLRVACQLVEAPSGTMLWSETAQVSMADLFQLQDGLVHRIVQSLAPQLSERERHALRRDVPASATAYEYYLRANQLTLIRTIGNMKLARDLYRQCVEEDAGYAPAWARLGRVHRFIEKFDEEPTQNFRLSDAAFQRAFELNPDLSLAHNLYTPIECDRGNAPQAMVRLLERARFRSNDPDLFAGLVQACRYAGELEASLAADERARRLDPQVTTSVAHTYFLLGDYQRTLDYYGSRGGYYLDCAALAALGRNEEALERLRRREATGTVHAVIQSLRAYLEGDFGEAARAIEQSQDLTRKDPETQFYTSRHMARIGECGPALEKISSVIEAGFLCAFSLRHDPWLEALHAAPGFAEVAREAERRETEAHAAFVAAGGERILRGPLP
ncbi:MAG: protein kinase [Acidobacteriia bacterium]|nr:protein kinase [Terriglobia bacterium]